MEEQIFCDTCGMLIDKNKYEKHLKFGHKEKKEHFCDLCKRTFTSLYNLQYHIAHHVNARQFLCTECPKKYNTQADLMQHQRIHEKERDPYICADCGMSFQIRSRYNTHLKTHKKDSKGPKECSICMKKFVCLSSHNRIVHMNLRKYDCNFCDKKFGKKSGKDRHILTVHEKQRNFVCNLCDKAFGEKAQLQKHFNTHSSVKKAKFCTHCGENFDDIQGHFRVNHQDLQHECEQCFMRFAESTELDRHIKMCHAVGKKLKCKVCDKVFAEKKQLSRHLKLHAVKQETDERIENLSQNEPEQVFVDAIETDGEQLYEDVLDELDIKTENSNSEIIEELIPCKECNKLFKSQVALDKHIFKMHNSESENADKNQYQCEKCSKAFRKLQHLKIHFDANHTDKTFKCKDCERTFNYKSALERHVLTVHEKLKNHVCSDCGKSFASKFELNQHFDGYHNEDSKAVRTCKFCGKVFMKERNLSMHMQAVHSDSKFSCELCFKTFSFKSSKNRHVKIIHHNQKQHKCEQCQKYFGTRYDYRNHVEHYHSETPNEIGRYHCSECSKDFVSSSALSSHKKGIHLNIKPAKLVNFRCKICKELITNKYRLDKHMAQVHLGGKFLKRRCQSCKLDFQFYEEFKAHCDAHKDIFICMICGEGFADEDQLSIHKDIHKRIDFNLRQFICDLCGHRLFNKIQLDVHMRKHIHESNFYVCEICGNGYKYIAPFLYHKKLHENIRDFICAHCGKEFLRKHDLLVHTRQHTNEKPFKCSVCDKRFSQRYNLNNHLQSHATTKVTFSCSDCNIIFNDKIQLKSHEYEKHPERRPFKCSGCTLSFKYEHTLKAHNFHKHSTIYSNDQEFARNTHDALYINSFNVLQ